MAPRLTLAKNRTIATVGSYNLLSRYKSTTPQYKLIEHLREDSMWWKCDNPMDKRIETGIVADGHVISLT